MKYASVRLVFDRKHVATKEKAGLVQIEVCYQRKRKWMSTGVKLFAGEWNAKYNVVNRLDAVALNNRLAAQVASIQQFITSLIDAGEMFSFDALEHHLATQKPKQSFIEFVEQRIEERGDISESTRKAHRGIINALVEFGGIVYFDDLTKPNIVRFDDWLHTKGYKQTTVYGYHKRLKAYIYEAIRFDIIQQNPYRQVRISRGKSEGVKYLTADEVGTLQRCSLSGHMERVRDLFVFQCYTGLSYSDLAKFDWNDVREYKGDYIISDTRRKTDENYYIVLLEPAMAILRKYGYKLPVLSNQKYNDFLKAVVAAAGIDKPVTTHWARHTFAVMMLSMGARMQNVSKMLGHASPTMTESVYAKVLADDVRRDFDLIKAKLSTLSEK